MIASSARYRLRSLESNNHRFQSQALKTNKLEEESEGGRGGH